MTLQDSIAAVTLGKDRRREDVAHLYGEVVSPTKAALKDHGGIVVVHTQIACEKPVACGVVAFRWVMYFPVIGRLQK